MIKGSSVTFLYPFSAGVFSNLLSCALHAQQRHHPDNTKMDSPPPPAAAAHAAAAISAQALSPTVTRSVQQKLFGRSFSFSS